MLFLLLQLGADRYALDASLVAEVLPLVAIKQIPRTPRGVAGLFDYRGTPTPVIDLNELTFGRPAQRLLSTRIILARYRDEAGETHLLGLIAEKVTETLRREPSDFVESGVRNSGTPYLGAVTNDGRGLVQRIEVSSILPSSVRDVLFGTRVTS